MDVMVSICYTAYNHEKYIARALESFVMQETDFLYEIIIHDDASTDGTYDIISKYEKTYPTIIKVIRQKQNQYSKGVHIIEEFMYEQAKGKYIALCDGDDYWIDPQKLQKQVDHMEKNPDCSLCMHGAVKVDENDEQTIAEFIASSTSKYFTTDEIITNEHSFSTNSMLYLKEFGEAIPDVFLKAPVGDYPLMIWLSLKGKVYYLQDIMAAYRVLAVNSWTRNLVETPGLLKKHFQAIESWLRTLNTYTEYDYYKSIQIQILKNRLLVNLLLYNLKGAKAKELRGLYKKLTYKEKVKLYIGHYFPFSVKLSHTLRRRAAVGQEKQK